MIEIDYELSAEITNALRARRRRRMGGFSPLGLFRSSEPGVWLDPSDLSTLFQDDAGTTPVTAAGQSVGRILDKSGRGNHATQSILASRPSYQVDANGRGYLSFDGIDDFLVTPTITPNTDKVQVFAGVRKLSDAAQGMVAEFAAGSGNGRFAISAPSALLGDFGFNSFGTSNALAIAAATAPNTSVVVGLGDIAGDTAIIRRNGVQVGQNTADQGTGNYLAYPLYIGRRGGTTLPFNGNLYGLVVRFGPNLDAGTIAATEAWMNTRTGAY